MPDIQTTVVELPDDMRDAMRREVNTGLMVTFINRDLTSRAALDVRTSIVLYDDAGVFEAAVPASIAELSNWRDILAKLFAETNVRFYSKGI